VHLASVARLIQRARRVISGESSPAQHALAAFFFFLAVSIALFPYVYGTWTLQDSAARGVFVDVPPAQNQLSRNMDPISAVASGEPDLALDHDLYLHEHQPPIWTPYVGFGQPLAAMMLSQPFSPVAWVGVLWKSARGYDVFLVVRLAVGGWLTYLYLRRFVRFVPAFGGGLAFAFSGALWTYMTMQDLTVDVMIPGLFYAAELLVRSPGPRSVAIAALIFATTTLGGQPESELIAAVVALLYWILRSVQFARTQRDRGVRILGASAAAVVLGACASAILVLPVAEYVPISWNQHANGTEELAWGSFFNVWQPMEALRYLAPLVGGPIRHDIFSPHFDGDVSLKGFFGCTTAFFALAALYEAIRRKLREEWAAPAVFFVCAALVLVLKRFGFDAVNWIGSLPILWRVAWVKYEEPTTAFLVAALAGFGIALLTTRRLHRVTAGLAAATLLLAIGVTTLPYQQKIAQANHVEFFVLSVLGALLFVGLAYGVSVRARGEGPLPARVALAAVALVALEPFCTWILPLYYVWAPGLPQSASPLRGTPYVSYLRSSLRPGERIFGEAAMIYPNWAEAFEIPDITAGTPLLPNRFLPFVQQLVPDYDLHTYLGFGNMNTDFHKPVPRKFLALSSVTRVLVGCPFAQPVGCPNVTAAGTVPGFTAEFTAPGVTIFRFGDAVPRLALYRGVHTVESGDAALATMRSAAFDPARDAVVEQPAGEAAALERAPKEHVVAGTITTFQSRYVRGDVDAPWPALALFTDTWFPGWHAFVDGREQPILRANYLFRGVVVPPGRHVLEFRYAPRSFTIGAAITGLSVLAILVLLLISYQRPKETAT
jgi:Bacterial membrane protein YfhO